MEFIIPELEKHLSGAYKISFNDNWFYIGSTRSLKRRFSRWKAVLPTGKFKTQKNINAIRPLIKTVRFEVLNICVDYKQAEIQLLQQYWNDPLLLNRCPDVNSPKGMRPYNGYVKMCRQRRFPNGIRPKPFLKFYQKIAQFDLDGNLIKVYQSKTQASDKLNCRMSEITKHLRGEKDRVRGFRFKLVTRDGSFIERKPFVHKQPKGYHAVDKFYQIDQYGNIVNEFYNCATAATVVNGSRSQISDVLRKRERHETVKGFRFVYAKEYDLCIG